MRIRLTIPEKKAKDVKKSVEPLIGTVEKEDWDFEYEMVSC